MEVNLAYYRKKDWRKFLNMIGDRDSMHHSWEDWHNSYLKIKLELSTKGMIVNDIVVDLHELRKYCLNRGLKINGKARSQFVSNMK